MLFISLSFRSFLKLEFFAYVYVTQISLSDLLTCSSALMSTSHPHNMKHAALSLSQRISSCESWHSYSGAHEDSRLLDTRSSNLQIYAMLLEEHAGYVIRIVRE